MSSTARWLGSTALAALLAAAPSQIDAQEEGPASQENAHARALELVTAGNERGALTYLESVDSVQPVQDAALVLLYGTLLRQSGQLGRSIAVFERGLEEPDASAATVWTELAVTRSWTGDLDGAEAAYRAALDREPGFRPARAGLARILRWQGASREAERLYKGLLEDGGDPVEAQVGMGFLALEDLQGAEAASWFNQALSSAPHNEEALEGLRRVHEARRLSVLVNATSASGDRGAARWAGSASYRVTPDGTLVGALDFAPRSEDLVASDPNAEATSFLNWTASVGWAQRVTPKWDAAVRVQRLSAGEGAGYFATLESSRRLGASWTFGAGARGGTVPTIGTDVMGWLGITRVGDGGRSGGATLFYGSDFSGAWSRSILLTASSGLGDRLTVRLGMARGWTSSVGFYEATFGGRVALGQGREIHLDLFRFVGAFERAGARVGAKLVL